MPVFSRAPRSREVLLIVMSAGMTISWRLVKIQITGPPPPESLIQQVGVRAPKPVFQTSPQVMWKLQVCGPHWYRGICGAPGWRGETGLDISDGAADANCSKWHEDQCAASAPSNTVPLVNEYQRATRSTSICWAPARCAEGESKRNRALTCCNWHSSGGKCACVSYTNTAVLRGSPNRGGDI